MYDAIVIGAGAGGLSAAARLTAAGKKVLLVEDKDRLGGRASSETIDGFTVNLGAISLNRGGVFEETFALVGVPLDIRTPTTAAAFRIKRKLVDLSKGGLGLIIGGITKQAAMIGAKLARSGTSDVPEALVTTEKWLRRYTRNTTVHAIFRNMCAALFSVNANELPVSAFLTFLGNRGKDSDMGFCPRGTIGLWNDLGDGIRKAGGDIWLNAAATGLHVEDGRVVALDVVRDGQRQRVATQSVISNIGPTATARLDGAQAFGADYLARAEALRPAGMVVVNFATRERLVDTPGIICFGPTRRLCTLAELTATVPEIAPAGWHQYVAYAVPVPALGDFDEATEIDLAMQDLRDEFPAFTDARMLSTRVMRDQWPAQRVCAGFDMPQETPIPNLWHVGDAVKPFGTAGTGACAETGKRAAALAIDWLGQTASEQPTAAAS